jgi:peptide deformylase
MILPIVKYGDPVLRQKGKPVEAITPEITRLIEDMFETMYAARGLGLAAQQVGRALQLAIIDVRGILDRPSTLELDGKPAEVDPFMPVVLINPQLKPFGKHVAGPEGCLSFPEIFAEISRAESVEVTALNEEGETLHFRCGGLLARAILHEGDHLNGILFIDRMSLGEKESFQPELEELQAVTKAALKRKK